MPAFSPSFAMARNFSTIGRVFPGLQYMMSRTMNIGSSFAWSNVDDCPKKKGPTRVGPFLLIRRVSYLLLITSCPLAAARCQLEVVADPQRELRLAERSAAVRIAH